jgi:hypothetical protein
MVFGIHSRLVILLQFHRRRSTIFTGVCSYSIIDNIYGKYKNIKQLRTQHGLKKLQGFQYTLYGGMFLFKKRFFYAGLPYFWFTSTSPVMV